MRRLALGLVVGLLLGAAVPTAALAGSVSKRDRGGPRTKALDIKSVKAVGGGFGLIVKVRFKGNIERAIGRGRLRSAAVALVLRPKRGRGKAAVLATRGRGKRARTLRRTSSKDVEVVRLGKELRFYLLGGGLSSVRRLQVKSFARLTRGARASDNELILNKGLYDKIVDASGSDSISLPPPSKAEACNTLRGEIAQLVRKGESSSTTELAGALLAHGCADDLELVKSGYEHVAPGDSRVCGDFTLDPDLVPGLANFEVFLLDSAGKQVDRRYFRDAFDASGKLHAVFKITKAGKYTLVAREDTVEDEDEVGIRTIKKVITVIAPPSPSTADCI